MLKLHNDGLTPCYCCLCAGLVCTISGWVSLYVTCCLVTFTKEYSELGSLIFVHRLVSFVVGELLCKMMPNRAFSFICCVALVTVWFVLNFPSHICRLECAMQMPRLGYLLWYSLCFQGIVFLSFFQCGQHMSYYMFCIVLYIFHWNLLCLVVSCHIIGCL